MPEELKETIAQRDYNLMVYNAHLVPDVFIEKFCWAGTVEFVAHKVIGVVKTGVKNITFLPHAPAEGDIRETIQEFTHSVKPLVEQALC